MGINEAQALDCLRSADLIGIGMEADTVRRRLHPEDVVSYVVDLSVIGGEADFHAIRDTGVSCVSLLETLDSEFTFAQFEASLTAIQARFPSLKIHHPSGATILRLADAAGLNVNEAVARLREAGLSSFAGDGFRIGESERIFDLHSLAHRAGIRTVAGMIFGAGESFEQRVEHLFAIRKIQEETGGFTSFTPSGFVTSPTIGLDAPTAVEYMRTLAVSRMVLDNVENIESSCLTQGLKVVQMALRFGANDAGAIPAIGSKNFTEEDLRRVIRDAGFKPVERDTLYRTMFLNN